MHEGRLGEVAVEAINRFEEIAANAEEAGSASEEMAGQAKSMRGLVNQLVALVHGQNAV